MQTRSITSRFRLLLGAGIVLLVLAADVGDASACFFRRRCRTVYYPVRVVVVYVPPAAVVRPPAERIPAPRESKEGEKPPAPKDDGGR